MAAQLSLYHVRGLTPRPYLIYRNSIAVAMLANFRLLRKRSNCIGNFVALELCLGAKLPHFPKQDPADSSTTGREDAPGDAPGALVCYQ